MTGIAPPAGPRRRRVGAPIRKRTRIIIGNWVRRTNDAAVFQVRDVDRREKKVQLAPDFGDSGPITIPRAELERDYTLVAS